MRFSTVFSSILPVLALSTPVVVQIPSSHHIPNPSTLPPSTSATLTTLSRTYTAPLNVANAFLFRNVSSGSYLLSVSCATHAFAPLRVDVAEHGTIEAWGTFRGNEWDNRGEVMGVADGNRIEVRAVGGKDYYLARSGFSPLSLLKNPMILIGGISMIAVFGMPYLMDNMDPEMRAEFEESQKGSGLAGALVGRSGQDQAASSVANFDAAAWLAGASTKKNGDGGGGGEKAVR